MVLSFGLATADRFEEAVAHARTAVQYDPESFVAQWELGLAYHWNGLDDEALAVLEPLWAESSHHWIPLGLVPTYMKMGRREQARNIYGTLVARRGREYVPAVVRAACAAALGEGEEAIAYCGEAVNEHEMLFAVFPGSLPDFAAP